MAYKLEYLFLIIITFFQPAVNMTLRDHFSISEKSDHISLSLQNMANYISSVAEETPNRFKMADDTRQVVEELIAFCPKSKRHWLEETSMIEWLLNQEISEEGLASMFESFSMDEKSHFKTTGFVTSDWNVTSECGVDLDALLGVFYEALDPQYSLYRDASLTKTLLNLAHNIKVIPKLDLTVCNTPIDKLLKKQPKPTKTFPSWGWSFVDAMAKPPAAILGGQLQWVGGYEMCNKIQVSYEPANDVNNTRSFSGRYCRIMIGQVDKSEANNTNSTGPPLPLSLGFGLCFPDTCTKDGVLNHLKANPGIVNKILGAVGFEVKSVFCGNDLEFSDDSRAQTAFGILLTLVILVSCATLYDLVFRPFVIQKWVPDESYYSSISLSSSPRPVHRNIRNSYSDSNLALNGNVNMNPSNGHLSTANGHLSHPSFKHTDRQSSVASTKSLVSNMTSDDEQELLFERPSTLERIEAAFAGFSASASFRKIFDVINLNSHHMPVIDGLRFLSVVYALGGNTCLFGIIYTESITTSNLVSSLLELPHQFAFQPVINYTFCADTFLVLSGTVITYHWLRRLEKTDGRLGFKQIIHFYLHRYWSMMPVMMLVLMTYTCLYKYLLSGPISPPQITDAENCRVNWWTNLLMLGNLVNTDASCLAWTWFAPMLFQLHIITPIILIPLSYKRWAGWLSVSAMYVIFLSTVSGVVKEHIYGDAAAWYSDYIMTPWCRAGPYFIGVAAGILLYDKIPQRIPKNLFTKLLSWVLMVVAVGLILMCAFITYTKYRREDAVKWTEDQTVAYQVFIRSVWGLAIAYIILASQSGFGGFVCSVLSHKSFTPASRLAYPVFVVHAIFIFKYAYSQFDTIYINFENLLYIFFGHLILVYLVAMVIGILFLYPFQGLEYAFFGAKTKLDIITAGSCDQGFRDIQILSQSTEQETDIELKDKVTDDTQGVTFM